MSSAYGINITAVPVDPVNGRSKLVIVDHAGPASYTTNGETFPQQSTYGGPNSLGLNSVSQVIAAGAGITEDGLYLVVPVFGGAGAEKGTVKLVYYTVASIFSGSGVLAQASSAANLSTSNIRLAVIGG